MAGFVGGTPIPLTGTTWVTAVAAPASGKQRQILGVHVYNKDTVTHTFKQRKNVGGVFYEDYRELVLPAGGKGQLIVESIVLDATNMSYQVQDDAVATTTEPEIDVAVFEVP